MWNEAQAPEYQALESQIRGAAHIRISERELTSILDHLLEHNDRNIVPTRGHHAVALAVLGLVAVTLAVAALGVSSRHQNGAPSGSLAGKADTAMDAAYVGDVEPGLDREVLAAQATEMTTVEEAAEGMGIPLTALQDISGTSIAGVWASRPEMKPPFLLIEYDDGTLIDVSVLETSEEAALLADPGTNDPQLAPLISTVDLDGTEAYAIGKVDVPAAYTTDGDIVPGTGVCRGTAKISWATDVFAVRVMSQTRSVDDLLPIAKGARVAAARRQGSEAD